MASRAETILEVHQRVSAIVESPEGRNNPEMAMELALRSQLSADAARDLLRKAPSNNPFVQAMGREGPIGIAATGNPAASAMTGDKRAARLEEIKQNVAAFNASRRPRLEH